MTGECAVCSTLSYLAAFYDIYAHYSPAQLITHSVYALLGYRYRIIQRGWRIGHYTYSAQCRESILMHTIK